MVIKKYQADTEQAAIILAKEDLGSSAIVMNIKKVQPRGIFRFLMKGKVEVTAAVDDNVTQPVQFSPDSTAVDKTKPEEPVSLKPNSKTLDALEQAMRNGELDGNPKKDADNNRVTKKSTADNNENRNERKDSVKTSSKKDESVKDEVDILEKKLNNIQDDLKSLIDERIRDISDKKDGSEKKETDGKTTASDEKTQRAKVYKDLIFEQLVSSEMAPEYAKEIIDEIQEIIVADAAIDQILSVVYQKIILKLGQPKILNTEEDGTMHCSIFVGPTGVGKTTTIAKIASFLKLNHKRKVALITADTYRIAAVEQLKTYASILDIPLSVVYTPEEMKETIELYKDYDHVLVDTAGRSHHNDEQLNDLKELIDSVDEKEVYLALSITTKYQDLLEVAEYYKTITDYNMIFTKLDETGGIGNLYNLRRVTGAPLSYVTFGQNVPDDFSGLDTQYIAKKLLGGKVNGSGRKS